MMGKMDNKLLDINGDLLKLCNWNGVLLFWGVKAFNLSGEYQPLKWCNPRFCRGDGSYTIGSLELKATIAVLGSSFNSPTICGRIQDQIFYFPSGGQNSWFAVAIMLPQTSYLTVNPKGNFMTTENIKSSNRKAIIVFNQPYHQVSSEKEQEIISSCRKQHQFDVVKSIYCQNKYEANTYKEMIDDITAQDKPVVIIDAQTYIFPQSTISSAVLGTLEHMNLAEIYTYSTSYDRISGKVDNAVEIQKRDTNLITDSTYQLKAAFESSNKDNEWGE